MEDAPGDSVCAPCLGEKDALRRESSATRLHAEGQSPRRRAISFRLEPCRVTVTSYLVSDTSAAVRCVETREVEITFAFGD